VKCSSPLLAELARLAVGAVDGNPRGLAVVGVERDVGAPAEAVVAAAVALLALERVGRVWPSMYGS
jgi:hypothetical protein